MTFYIIFPNFINIFSKYICFFSEPESSQDRTPTYVNQDYQIPIKATIQPNYPIPVRTASSKGYSQTSPKSLKAPNYGRRGELDAQVYNKFTHIFHKLQKGKQQYKPTSMKVYCWFEASYSRIYGNGSVPNIVSSTFWENSKLCLQDGLLWLTLIVL